MNPHRRSAQAPAMAHAMQTAPMPAVAAVNAGDMSATQQIVQQQLQLMQQQLALLNGTPIQNSTQNSPGSEPSAAKLAGHPPKTVLKAPTPTPTPRAQIRRISTLAATSFW